MEKLTAKRLRELVHYDPETGVFTRIVEAHKGRYKSGETIGGVHKTLGYVMGCVDKNKIYMHRAAHLYMTGEWPRDHMDHLNGIRSDNRWSNLRSVPQSVNNQNYRRARSNNKSGLLGVKTCKDGFQARIAVNKRQIHLGKFDTAEKAHEAYLSAKRKVHIGCTI